MSAPSAEVRFPEAVPPHACYLRLGASLYMPGTRTDLREVLTGIKFPSLRSVVVCTEDAVHPRALHTALANLRHALSSLPDGGPMRFVRPRDPEVLDAVIRMPGAQGLHGVSLPKFDESNSDDYLSVLARAPWLAIMPIVETEVAFAVDSLTRLRRRLDPVRKRVLCVRVGGNDLLQLIGMKRPAHLTAYDTPLRLVIDHLMVVFRPHGYEVSAPVFEHIDRPQVLAREVALDVARGLIAKTAIHPMQIGLIESAYTVSRDDAALAEAILDPEAAAVFRFNGAMAEPATHTRWAKATLARAAVYGLAGVAAHHEGAVR